MTVKRIGGDGDNKVDDDNRDGYDDDYVYADADDENDYDYSDESSDEYDKSDISST